MSARARVAGQPGGLARLRNEHGRALRDTFAHLRLRSLGTLVIALAIGVTLALPAGLHALAGGFDSLSDQWRGALKATLFLKDSIDRPAGEALAAKFARRDGVRAARYLSREDALAEFRAHSGFGDALDLLQDNPLPAAIIVTPDATRPKAQIQALVKELEAAPEVETARMDAQWLERLYATLDVARRGGLLATILLALTVIVVIGNTIRLDVQTRREEIVVLRLIGASDAFIRRPFLYLGMVYGLLGAGVALLILAAARLALVEPLRDLGGLFGGAATLPATALLPEALGVVLAGVVLGGLAAALAVARQLGNADDRGAH